MIATRQIQEKTKAVDEAGDVEESQDNLQTHKEDKNDMQSGQDVQDRATKCSGIWQKCQETMGKQPKGWKSRLLTEAVGLTGNKATAWKRPPTITSSCDSWTPRRKTS